MSKKERTGTLEGLYPISTGKVDPTLSGSERHFLQGSTYVGRSRAFDRKELFRKGSVSFFVSTPM